MNFTNFSKITQRGAIFVICALVLPALILFMGLAIDFGFIYVQRNKLQDVADATVLAAAIKMSEEGRYLGAKGTDYRTDMVVGQEIIDFVKENDADFSGFNINEVIYKGTYRYQTGDNSWSERTINTDDSNNRLVKLVDLEAWTNPEKGPKITADTMVKIEYAITGRLNATNFLDKNVDEAGNYVSDYTKDDRVRLRLTKRIPLHFLSVLLSDKYQKGVPVTVMAAAKPRTIAGGSSGGGGGTPIESSYTAPYFFIPANPTISSDLLNDNKNSDAMIAIIANNSYETLLPGGSNNSKLSPGYYNINQNLQPWQLNEYMKDSSVTVFEVGGVYLIAQKQSDGEYRVFYLRYTNYDENVTDENIKQVTAVSSNYVNTTIPVTDSKMLSTIRSWIKDINYIKSKDPSSAANTYKNEVMTKGSFVNFDRYNTTNRLYNYPINKLYDASSYRYVSNNDKSFNINNVRIRIEGNMNDGGGEYFYTNVIQKPNNANGVPVLTNYHLAYNKNNVDSSGNYVGTNQYLGNTLDHLDYKDTTNIGYVTYIPEIWFTAKGMIATEGVTYGDIYCSQGELYILGKNNTIIGNIYCESNTYIGGENNHIFAADKNLDPDSETKEKFIYLNGNDNILNKGYTKVNEPQKSTAYPSEVSITLDTNTVVDNGVIIGNGNLQREVPVVEEQKGAQLVE